MKNNIETFPFFSIVIPTYNRGNTICNAIESIVKQDFNDYELIIIDDGSSDDTAERIKRFQDTRIQYYYQDNKGRSAARNIGAKFGRGKYLTFLDSDDQVMPEWLSSYQKAFLLSEKNALVYVGVLEVVKGENKRTILPQKGGEMFENQSLLCGAGGTFAVRRELFNAIGGYAENLVYSENTELALRMIPQCVNNGLKVSSIQRPLVVKQRRSRAERFIFKSSPDYLLTTLESAKYIINRHEDRLNKQHRSYAVWSSIAGVNAARLGRYSEARLFFWKAIKAYPFYWKDYARLVFCFLPFMGHKIWKIKKDNI